VQLPILDGTTFETSRLQGRETVVLFWNPECGFCREMHERLTAFERRSNGHRRLLIVSAGEAAAIRAEGFRSPVVVDPDFALAGMVGVGETPTALLVDAQGRVASPVASGADAVLELAGA
jgi:thiol-disulfide isomerase/thioredoxin